MMGHFLEVAYQVLDSSGEPLSPEEITKIGLDRGWLVTRGKTPTESMRARLSTVVLLEKEASLFMRTATGKFGLRAWAEKHPEYITPRFKKSLLDENIVVFPKNSLKKYIPTKGLYATPPNNRNNLISELVSMQRNQAEHDYSVIQLVSAFIIQYKDKYLTYKRTKRLPEDRLHGYYSIPFGGHLNPEDILPLFDIFDPKLAHFVLNRELEEELRFPRKDPPALTYLGLLYDDSRDVSKQHLGVVYIVNMQSEDFTIGERGFLTDAKFESLNSIQSRRNEFENWSWILMDNMWRLANEPR
jgi:predicted NUDIX family phosphoesterase